MSTSGAGLRFLVLTLLIQIAGFLICIIVNPGYVTIKLAIWCVVACGLSLFLKLSKPWLVANILMPWGIAFIFLVQIPGWLLIFFVLLFAGLFIPTLWTRVPFYPTSELMYKTILAELPSDSEFSFIDLGSGFGSLLLFLANELPKGRFYGVEISPLAYIVSKIRTSFRANVCIKFKSFWKFDLSDFDYVYAFLAPPPMEMLWAKCSKEMKDGSILLINSFPVLSKATKIIDTNDRRKTRLYVYCLRKGSSSK